MESESSETPHEATTPPVKTKRDRRGLRRALFVIVISPLIVVTGFAGAAYGTQVVHDIHINTDAYKAEFGKWDMVELPEDVQINAIHSVMLPTGKVLLIAGSGNDRQQFEAGTFETLVYDPETGATTLIDTPEDLFCNGHAHLPNGNILIAGGTQGYEILPENMTNAGGYVQLTNENPDKEFVLEAGTELVGVESGLSYVTDAEVVVPPAAKDPVTFAVAPTSRNVYASAVLEGDEGLYEEDRYLVASFEGEDAENLHGYAPKMSMDKKEYQGIDSSYEFDPWAEEYIEVDPLNYARWYPTLTSLHNGHVIALSGLDNAGQILDGQNEIYNPHTHEWTEREELRRFFPTYPSVFQTAQENVLFSAGPSTGWGPHDKGRDPGFWDLTDNTFDIVPGLRDPGLLETGSASWLGPVNDQRMVVIGGGDIGDKPDATGRIDVIDLDEENPAFTALAELPQETRYPNLVTLPNGDLFITNGAMDYRGQNGSDILKSYNLSYEDGTLTPLADPRVGRNYHSSAVLLPNGQILVVGSDPLYADAENTIPGEFDQRIEIYSPPYLFNEDGSPVNRPEIRDTNLNHLNMGEQIQLPLTKSGSGTITQVNLVKPAAVTHVTDTNQRLVALDFVQEDDMITATLPENAALLPPGSYMLYLVDDAGTPSVAVWAHVGDDAVSH